MSIGQPVMHGGESSLCAKADQNKYSFSYALNKRKQKLIARGETHYLSTEVAGGFTGVYFGMYATGGGRRSTTPAFFDWFEYVPIEAKTQS